MDLTLDIKEKKSRKREILDQAKSNLVAQGLSPKLQTCCFIPATNLVPKEIAPQFWEAFSQNPPFSWGDNNRTLISASDFLDYVYQIEDNFELTEDELKPVINELENLEDTYIDLEN